MIGSLDSNLNSRKTGLEMQIEVTNVKLRRAEQLLQSTGGERERWLKQAESKLEFLSTLPGDMFLASAAIAYLGPFVDVLRNEALAAWNQAAVRLSVPCSTPFDMTSVLGDPVQIRAWNIAGVHECLCELPCVSFRVACLCMYHVSHERKS